MTLLSQLLQAAGLGPIIDVARAAAALRAEANKPQRVRAIGESSEWRRIRDIPRRELNIKEIQDLTPVWRIRDHGCSGCDLCIDPITGNTRSATLRPIQSAMLWEAEKLQGGYFRVGVGWGKELVCLLLPDALHSSRAVILTEARLKRQMLEIDIPRYGRHFRLPLGRIAGVVSYSELSSPVEGLGRLPPAWKWLAYLTSAIYSPLAKLRPDAFICNEAHTLENDESVRTKRFWRDVAKSQGAPVVVLSGTLGQRGIKKSRKLPKAALREFSPLPHGFTDADDWGRALDAVSDDWQDGGAPAMEPGAILDLLGPVILADEIDSLSSMDQQLFISGPEGIVTRARVARKIHGRRIRETPGVVQTTGASVEARLILRGRRLELPSVCVELLEELRSSWMLGDEVFCDAKDVARVARQLSLGFYYRWVWPNNKKDYEWLEARKNWNAFVREFLRHRSRPGVDSPDLLRRAVERGDVESKDYAAWKRVSKRYNPTPPTETIWLDRNLVVSDVLCWGRELTVSGERGIVWYDHLALEGVFREASIQLFPAGEAGDEILNYRGTLCAASMAHHKGKNLQWASRALVTNPPTLHVVWEQLLGRMHRPGQTAERVTYDVYQHDRAQRRALATATAWARAESESSEPQRLAYAEREGIEDGEEELWRK